MTHDPNMRVSNAEREAIIAKLHAATEEGRLDLDEFADRSRQAYEARTYGEVERLLADLPDDQALAVPTAKRPIPAGLPAELRLKPTGSSVKRDGDWVVPPKIIINATGSSVKLDCRHAVIHTDTVDLDVRLLGSSLTVVLPEGAYAVDDNTEVFGSSVKNRATYKGGTAIRFSVSGKATGSSVQFRHERRFLWWRW
jgi:hypothetical protein